MNFDLIVRNAHLAAADAGAPLVDIGIRDGRFAAIQPSLAGGARETLDAGGRLVSPGFVETHIHLDKACSIDRCECETTRFPHGAMARVSAIKHTFTLEDVHERARRTLEKCIGHGCTLMRTHVEVDPEVGMRGFEGVKALIAEYAWAIDIEICVLPQKGILNNPGTEEMMVRALKDGARVIGAAPTYDADPAAQIRRVFELARASSTWISTCIWTPVRRPPTSTPCWCANWHRSTAGAAGSPSAMSRKSPPCRSRISTRLPSFCATAAWP